MAGGPRTSVRTDQPPRAARRPVAKNPAGAILRGVFRENERRPTPPGRDRVRRRSQTLPLVILLLAMLGCLQEVDRESRPNPLPDVYLIVVDTLRADHLPTYGYGRNTAPTLDRFAKTATVFEDVVAPSSWTLPSTASLLTALYPATHGLSAKFGKGRKSAAMRPDVETLAMWLGNAGYATGAVVANPWVNNTRHGLNAGFESFVATDESAGAINRATRAFLEKNPDRPVFLFLHYMDVHGPYPRATSEDLEALGAPGRGQGRALTASELESRPRYLGSPHATLGEDIDDYDTGIRRWDAGFAELLTLIESREGRPEPLIAVVSDHGEEFLDHGGWNHGVTLFEEQLAVPWIMRSPGRPPERRAQAPVSLVDVAPTLLGRLGIDAPEWIQGRDVLAEPARGPVFSETQISNAKTVFRALPHEIDRRAARLAMRVGKTKIIRAPGGARCFDLANDPLETSPSCAGHPALEDSLAQMEAWEREARRLGLRFGSVESFEAEEEQAERLRALGYVE